MYTERIKQIRRELDLSVAKMADRIQIPARTIAAYERGERMPSIEFLAQMCTTFQLNANWFLTGQGEMFDKKSFLFEILRGELRSEMRKILHDEGVLK